MKKFSDLRPEFWQRYASFTPETGGVDPLPEVDLAFDCPVCAGGRVLLVLTSDPPDEPRRKWHADPLPGTTPDWASRITISPSVNNAGPDRHGRGRPCAAHFSVVRGEIVPS